MAYFSPVQNQDFPGGPMANSLCSQCRGLRFNPWSGTRSHMLQVTVHTPQLKIPQAAMKIPRPDAAK